ncbi:MAG: 30S ribosomal protein S9 [Candidatus Hodgkinia cicadicola]
MQRTQNFKGGIRAFAFKKKAKAIARIAPSDSLSITVNGIPFEHKFNNIFSQMAVISIFEIINSSNFIIVANTWGGGIESQACALRYAIVKCLLGLNYTIKPALTSYGYVTTDCRKVERKKSGLAKARKAFQFSKR